MKIANMLPIKEALNLLQKEFLLIKGQRPHLRIPNKCPKWPYKQEQQLNKFNTCKTFLGQGPSRLQPIHPNLLIKNLQHSHSGNNLQQIRHVSNFSNGERPFSRLSKIALGILFGSLVSGVGYVAWTNSAEYFVAENASRVVVVQVDYRKVYDAIESILYDENYDDSSYGPVFVRLAWHASGSYDVASGTGGSSKGTMRFEPEASFGANKGLDVARQRLEIIKQQFPAVSYGDIWTLAAVCAIQEMGGPIIPWRPGRIDGRAEDCPPDGRLPDGANGAPSHPRDIFYRMGFNDQEIACLIGAHTLGRCHQSRSGFEGPWTHSPTSFSNQYYVQLMTNVWTPKSWSGNQQFQDPSGDLMMLPADLVFKSDPEFRKWVEIYAKDEKRFFCDFAKAFQKLMELGVSFPEGTKTHKFKRKLS